MKYWERKFDVGLRGDKKTQYDMYYKLLDRGKTDMAHGYLLSLVRSPYSVLFHCPVCGSRLFQSDMPKKDYLCLPCMKYYTNRALLGNSFDEWWDTWFDTPNSWAIRGTSDVNE